MHACSSFNQQRCRRELTAFGYTDADLDMALGQARSARAAGATEADVVEGAARFLAGLAGVGRSVAAGEVREPLSVLVQVRHFLLPSTVPSIGGGRLGRRPFPGHACFVFHIQHYS